MKKFAAIVLALALCMSLGVSALADSGGTGNYNKDITIGVEGVAEQAATYSIVYEWGSMNFTYDFDETKTEWNEETHQYDITTGGNAGWNATTNTIKVTNHSSAGISVSAAFQSNSGTTVINNGVTATLTNNSFDLATAAGTAYDDAPSGSITLTISGKPANKTAFTLDTINLVISAS